MNNKKNGFTLVELLATLVILGIVLSITIVTVNGGFRSAKDKTEDVFVKTIEDALNIYIDSDAKRLNYNNEVGCIKKTHGSVKIYKASGSLSFNNVINSDYSPITASDLVNPANEGVSCNSMAPIEIYRDNDYVYYYKVAKNSFNCLLNSDGYITNLPKIDTCN